MNWPGETVVIQSEGLPSGLSWRSFRATWRMLMAIRSCKRKMRSTRPDVVLAMGSYASVGPVGAALQLHIPVVLHEANVLPGRTVALFSRWATAVAGSFEETRYYLRRKDLVLTGMPLRKELDEDKLAETEHKKNALPTGLTAGKFTILVTGGSRGAHKINKVAARAICEVYRQNPSLQVIHLTGTEDEQTTRETYERLGIANHVAAFTQNMANIYRASNLAICRSGAATCAELCAFGIPALLIPYPYATHDHQTMNARALEKKGIADMILEKDISSDWLADYIQGCMRTPERIAKMGAAASKISKTRAAEALADLVESTVAT